MRPKKPARHTVSILTGRKKTQFSHLCSSVIPYPIGTKFAREVPASKGSLHTKFEENRSSHFRDTSEQNFVLIASFFFFYFFFISSLRKILHKTRMRARIGLKFGTLKATPSHTLVSGHCLTQKKDASGRMIRTSGLWTYIYTMQYVYRVRNVKFRLPRINYQTTHKC